MANINEMTMTNIMTTNELTKIKMIEKQRIYDLINGSIIENSIEQIIEIDIEHLYGISKLKGAYILIFIIGRPYIGSTIDIRKRLIQHRKDTTKPNIEHIIFLRTKDGEDALLIEDWLITNLDCSNECRAIHDPTF